MSARACAARAPRARARVPSENDARRVIKRVDLHIDMSQRREQIVYIHVRRVMRYDAFFRRSRSVHACIAGTMVFAATISAAVN